MFDKPHLPPSACLTKQIVDCLSTLASNALQYLADRKISNASREVFKEIMWKSVSVVLSCRVILKYLFISFCLQLFRQHRFSETPELLKGKSWVLAMPVSRRAFIWPKDPRPGRHYRRGAAGRWKDVLTGKGPDIFIGREWNAENPSKQIWSNWKSLEAYANPFGREAEDWYDRNPKALLGGKRTEPYDFKTRKYKRWSPGVWSDVAYTCLPEERQPMWYRDADRMPYTTWPGMGGGIFPDPTDGNFDYIDNPVVLPNGMTVRHQEIVAYPWRAGYGPPRYWNVPLSSDIDTFS